MECLKCQFENEKGAKFCLQCGAKLELDCAQCGKTFPISAKFCDQCGQRLGEVEKPETKVLEAEGERKQVTVLFSDLSGYTAMSERLDPEEVKAIVGQIFTNASKIIAKYDGFVEKFIGDAVMAIFGVPHAHEDDPLRAIRAAREIHEVVQGLSSELEGKVGQSLSMHTGVNTGLVVTGEVDMERGTHGVSGETINIAARLSSLSRPGEIVLGPLTYHHAEGYFEFEQLEPITLKGKSTPVKAYRVVTAKEKPVTLHRLSGLRVELIGRKMEMARLNGARERLKEKKGTILSVCGDAGTGKSRLIEEFKSTLDLSEMQWFQGNAYAYSQNIPYFPLVDLLNQVFQIEEGDPPERIKSRIESGVTDLLGDKEDVIPYLGTLYALSYEGMEEVNPELWKSRLRNVTKILLSALARKAPTVFCLEDLHWTDPSFLEMLRQLLAEIREPAIVLCVYRPTFSLFTTHQLHGISKAYQEIRLQDLSPSEAQHMLELLLRTDHVPADLQRLIHDKAEGNPFYLEELINSMIEAGVLVQGDDGWKVIGSISGSDISPTIHGLIASRLDRLEKEAKRILQEASVIGRAFLYDILTRVTDQTNQCDRCLLGLERLDLIKTKSIQPDLEYIFKHALTQEVVYNGLLKKERENLHERIALVMEKVFRDRLPEFYETLAFHFLRGRSTVKAVEYLILSGRKSLSRYAVEEAHQYFGEAYDILGPKAEKTNAEKVALIDILNDWGYVYYYLGEINTWVGILNAHRELAESLGAPAKLGMFYSWLGTAHYMAGRPEAAHDSLKRALDLGESCKDQKVVGYACTFLTWVCADLARFDEAAVYGDKAQQIAKLFPSDQYLYFKSLGGLGYLHFSDGDFQKGRKTVELLLAYGERNANSRSKVIGHFLSSYGQFHLGDIPGSLKSGQASLQASEDPTYRLFGSLGVGWASLLAGDFAQVEEALNPLVDFCEKDGCNVALPWACIFLGPALIALGRMGEGMKLLERAKEMIHVNNKRVCEPYYEYAVGKVFSLIATGPKPSLAIMTKNIRFLAKNVPFASNKAAEHFNRAIEASRLINAKSALCLAHLDLGLLHKWRKESEQAKTSFEATIDILEKGGAGPNLEQAKEALASLGG